MTQSKGLDHWADILVIIIYLVAVICVGLWTLCRPNRGNTKSYFLAGRSMPWFALSLGWNMYPSIAVLLAVTGLYTVLGGLTAVMYTDTFQTAVMILGALVVVGFSGLTAVMYTDTFQTAVMILGALVVVGFSYDKVGGYNVLHEKYSSAVPKIRIINSTCGEPRPDAFHLFRDPESGDYPWPGLVLQATIGCLWYVCCDQVMAQRSLAAKNISHAKGGSVLAASLKLLPLYLILFPGMISRILFPDEVACVDPDECMKYCENPVGCSNIAYPKLVMELLPVGLRGLLMAVLMSAIMSSLTSIFNSSGTIFTMDIWRRIRSTASQRELLIVGRIFVLFMCGLSILWIPIVKSANEGKLFTYMTAVESYLGTPLGVLFLLSMLWKRTTEAAVFWGLVIAHIFGGVRLVLEMVYTAPLCGEEETRPAFLYKLHYLYFAQIELAFTMFVVIVISLFTKQRSDEELTGVTWWTRHKFSKKSTTFEEINLAEISRKEETNEKNENTTNIVIEEVKTENGIGKLKYMFTTLFGIQKTEETADFHVNDRKTFVKESVEVKRILNVSAIILMGIVAFLGGYYH